MKSFLIFKSHAVNFAVPTNSVKSIYWLPELSQAEAVPKWIAGLVNIHGDIVRVLDLGLRFSHAPRSYSSSTNLIWISSFGARYALIADSVRGLVDIELDQIGSNAPNVESDGNADLSELTSGVLKLNDEVIMQLNLDRICNDARSEECPEQTDLAQKTETAFPEGMRELFHGRMHQLAIPVIRHQIEKLKGYAIVKIGGIDYAIEMQYITEFTHLKQCTSMPCCPPHILGLINLRGEILSVIGMAALLNSEDLTNQNEAVILQFQSKRMALAVQQIKDFRYFMPQDISTLQSVDEHRAQCKFLLRYGDSVAGILNLEDILLSDMLDINEQV
jgi:purine-binding chemotaxis protein CheW